MKVLLVDDDDLSLEMLAHAVRRAGFELDTAGSGAEALEVLRRGDYRLVISDWEMPNGNGLDLCRAVRSGAFPRYIYFILLTSRDRKQDIVAGMSAGADDFMSKPFDPDELALRIRAGERVLGLETRDLTIFVMAKLAESRDPETGAHLERVRTYSRLLAEDLAADPAFAGTVNAEYCQLIYATSPLHDIGKVAIPDSILLKPDRLSDREFTIMKTHTTLGAATLDAALQQHPTARFLRMARDIAAAHHEHCDGQGYPGGLKGQDIPLCGRIVAVADVYDALTTKRPYKDPFTHDVARGILVKDSGTHFDPRIIQAFLKNEEQFNATRQALADERALAA